MNTNIQTIVTVKCLDQVLQLINAPRITSGGVNDVRAEFEFCPLWDGTTKTAVFYTDPKVVYHKVLVDDACDVPPEVLDVPGLVHMGVFGVDAAGKVVRTSGELLLNIEQGAITEATAVSDPTPELYQQVLAEVQKAREAAEDANPVDVDLTGAPVAFVTVQPGPDGDITYGSAITYDEQNLTDSQKRQARKNIDAADSSAKTTAEAASKAAAEAKSTASTAKAAADAASQTAGEAKSTAATANAAAGEAKTTAAAANATVGEAKTVAGEAKEAAAAAGTAASEAKTVAGEAKEAAAAAGTAASEAKTAATEAKAAAATANTVAGEANAAAAEAKSAANAANKTADEAKTVAGEAKTTAAAASTTASEAKAAAETAKNAANNAEQTAAAAAATATEAKAAAAAANLTEFKELNEEQRTAARVNISAVSYEAGQGLNDFARQNARANIKAVSYEAEPTSSLTEEEKAQARANIGAAAVGEGGGGVVPKNHASTNDEYGKGTAVAYGHVKLYNGAHPDYTADMGYAATPAALQNVKNQSVSVNRQTLTSEEKAQARANIDATAAYELKDSYVSVTYSQHITFTDAQKALARRNIGAAAVGEGGSWVQPDLDAAEGVDGHIKNRTHWREWEYTDISKEVTRTMEAGSAAFTDINQQYKNIVEGGRYRVTWDGVAHDCVCKKINEKFYIGDASIPIDGVAGTGEPFCVITTGSSTATVADSEKFLAGKGGTVTRTYKIAAGTPVYHKLPKEYLPDDIGGGGGATPDWNAAEGEPGHVLHRTHWFEQNGVLLEESSATIFEHPTFGKMWVIEQATKLTIGETYTVIYNGTPFNCVCQAAPAGLVDDETAVAMGNFSVVGGANTGEPFAMIISNLSQEIGIIDLTGSASVQVEIRGEVYHKIDPKFLPTTSYVYVAKSLVSEDVDEQPFYVSCTYNELVEKLCDPNCALQAKLLYYYRENDEMPMTAIAFTPSSAGTGSSGRFVEFYAVSGGQFMSMYVYEDGTFEYVVH